MCHDNLFICVILCLPSLADMNVKQMADYGYYMEMTLACIFVINTGSFVVRRRTGCSRDASVNCRTNCRDSMKLEFACIYTAKGMQHKTVQQLNTLLRVYQLT